MLGGVTSPVKYFFMGAMPELMSSRDLSFCGIREKLGRRKCPLLSKNDRYFSRNSLRPVHFIIRSPSFGTKIKSPVHLWDGSSVVPPNLRRISHNRRHSFPLTRGTPPFLTTELRGGPRRLDRNHLSAAGGSLFLSVQRRLFPSQLFS